MTSQGGKAQLLGVRITRQFSESGSWLDLGTIRAVGDTRPWPRGDRTASLPMSVHYAHGGLYSFTPSLTCIVICFVFEDSFRNRLDEILRKDRQTFTRPVSRGHEVLDPERQKTEEVRLLRQEYANLAARWFRENLPGVFSSGLLGDQLPTCELLTLHKTEPFSRPRGKRIYSFWVSACSRFGVLSFCVEKQGHPKSKVLARAIGTKS